MNFSEALVNEEKWTETENGALAKNSTGNALLDLYGSIGGLQGQDPVRIQTLFAEAYKESPLLATKLLFYARDIRDGLGERDVFRTILSYLADHHPEAVRPNLSLVGEFGRYDDLYCLVGTTLEDEMWQTMKEQLEKDIQAMEAGKSVSLLAKWVKTADASSEKTRKMGILTAQKLGYSVYDFKRIIRKLRSYLKIIEIPMSANAWGEVNYSAVPSKAMKQYRNAFSKHDKERYQEYLDSVARGDEHINSATLYPYDLIRVYRKQYPRKEDQTVELQWKNLPNYVTSGVNALVMADTSGSMEVHSGGRPIDTAIGLAIYFAERNTGAYHNLFMTFESEPHVMNLKGETLLQKYQYVSRANWWGSTDLEKAFELVLQIALDNHVSQEEMPKAIIVISDMEIDDCQRGYQWTFYDQMKALYAANGYTIPSIIFWNVDSRHDVFHTDADRKGVQLASGKSVSTFKNIFESLDCDPVEAMLKVLNNDRYACVRVEGI